MYVFRDEYIFDLEKSVVVEVPQAGHATYVFTKPDDVKHWVWHAAHRTRGRTGGRGCARRTHYDQHRPHGRNL